jgi:hypothetical protein
VQSCLKELACCPSRPLYAGHGRMLHSAGIHRGSSIRFAVPVDFQQDRPTIVSPSQQWPAGHAAGGHRAYPDDTPPEMVKQFGMEWHKVSHTPKLIINLASRLLHRIDACGNLDGCHRRTILMMTSVHVSIGHRNVCRGFIATKRYVDILGDMIRTLASATAKSDHSICF